MGDEENKTAKHTKNDSKILLNGKDIKIINPKQSALEFKHSEIDDPLKNTPNNPWKTYFDDWEIWNRIKKDIHRTHQTYAFFRSNHMICTDSASKSYRFPFDISSSPPPITPSMSSTLTPNIQITNKLQTKSVPIISIPEHNNTFNEDDDSLSDSVSELNLDEKEQRKQSMAENEIISDIESVNDDDDPLQIQNIDLPPPAAQNIKIKSIHSTASPSISSHQHIDPNKKARI